MKKIFGYDPYDEYDCTDMVEDLRSMCEKIMDIYGCVAKYGYFGAWDGPKYGGSFISTAKDLFGHITQDFTVPMDIELYFTDENMKMAELQRYSSVTPLDIPMNSLILLQHHHDGCNQYIIRACDIPEYGVNDYASFIEYCENNSKDIRLDDL